MARVQREWRYVMSEDEQKAYQDDHKHLMFDDEPKRIDAIVCILMAIVFIGVVAYKAVTYA